MKTTGLPKYKRLPWWRRSFLRCGVIGISLRKHVRYSRPIACIIHGYRFKFVWWRFYLADPMPRQSWSDYFSMKPAKEDWLFRGPGPHEQAWPVE